MVFQRINELPPVDDCLSLNQQTCCKISKEPPKTDKTLLTKTEFGGLLGLEETFDAEVVNYVI